MIAMELPDVKELMHLLLKEDAFDSFEVRKIEIRAGLRYDIDGKRDKDYFAGDAEEYAMWQELRPVVFELIKGKQRPKLLRVVFSAPQKVLATMPQAQAAFLNLTYEGSIAQATTGFAPKGFSLDRQAEFDWDARMERFFKKIGLAAQKIT